MRLLIVCLVIGLAFLVGCDGGGDPAGSDTPTLLNQPLTLSHGETQTVNDELQLTFQAIARDGRCPANVECAESGPVEVVVLAEMEGSLPAGLTLNPEPLWRELGRSPTMETHEGYGIILLSVDPYPQEPEDLQDTSNYTISLLVVELDNNNSVTAQLGEPFALKLGQQATLANGSLQITFQSIVEDWRCPVDIECETTGPATIELLIQEGESSTSHELVDVYFAPPNAPLLLENYVIKLYHLLPYPMIDDNRPEYAVLLIEQ